MRHLFAAFALLTWLAPDALRAQPPAPVPAPRPAPSPQPRPHAARVEVDPALVHVDDGDTVRIRWSASDAEQVRILGIDTPETRHVEHDLPYDQPFGREAEAFARGAFAAARRLELRRSSTLDPFGRTLGYLWIDGRNYSVMVVTARLAEESVTRYGDNGLPQEAAEVLAAARKAGPLPFESPAAFRARMRDVSRWMRDNGIYPLN
ncbi:MAG TPA: thermonuclease family protein [Vicinamibacteria bacterium]|nr:thermonuclease family protein [Vicinamibacteria bacterium]